MGKKVDVGTLHSCYQTGLLLLKQQHYDRAAIQFQRVLMLDSSHLHALFHLGVSYFYTQHYEAAKQCFEEVLKANPEDVEAWVNLGAIALKQQKGQEAINRFTRALSLNAAHEAARSNLAATFIHFNRYENALTHYLQLLERYPTNLEYLYHAALSEMTLGQLDQAHERFLTILAQVPDHFSVLYNLAVIALRAHHLPEAKTYLQRALTIQPDDESCQHLIAALTGQIPTAHASQVHAKRLFDQYALYYDEHLLKALHYQLPVMIYAILQTHGLTHFANALDLGCGTGLSGEPIRSMCSRLTGVDLSETMLARAKEKGIYEAYVASEATAFLETTTERFNLIIAADLLPYLGDLSAFFQGLQRCLQPSGQVVFSVEVSQTPPWQLQETGRYAHHDHYIQQLCEHTGLRILAKEQRVARQQADTSVFVWVYLATR